MDLSALSASAQKMLSAPLPLRQMAAKGIAPGLRPADALAVIVAISEGTDAALADVAKHTLAALPPALLNGALVSTLDPAVLHRIALGAAHDPGVIERILLLPQLASETVNALADTASEAVAELIAVNEERLIAAPSIIEKLYMSASTRMSTADRILELAVRHKLELTGIPAYREAAQAILNQVVVAPQADPTQDDVLFIETHLMALQAPVNAAVEDTFARDDSSGEEVVRERFVTLSVQLAKLTPTQKIRRALIGTASERLLLVRDKNQLVAVAAARSPKLQESEVAQITANRTMADEVLRVIALDRTWTKSHQIKLNLVKNPRTPFVFAAQLVPHLRDHELRALARSKDVPSSISAAARRQLFRKDH
jgi:hypothetical protein